MGSAADLILAADDEGPAIIASDYALGSFRGINVDGLDPLKLAALHAVLAGKEFGNLLAEYQPIAEASPNGPWLIKFPGELVGFLAGIPPEDHASVAVKWATSDQLQEEGWSAEIAEPFIARVVHFAQNAGYEGKEVFLLIYD
jgi:hypothetical protein